MTRKVESTSTDPCAMTPETINRIAVVIESLRDVPDEFPLAFREWAADWLRRRVDAGSTSRSQWSVEIRPYSVAELAKLPGMPGRTKLHEIIKDLNLRREQIRNEGGRLTPRAVQLILERLSVPRCELKNEIDLNEPFR